MPTVSVIMNCLDAERYLRQAIDSVYAQTYKDWEIIFWDNGSTDNSPKIANSYDNRLKYFRSENTVLLGEARNYAIEKTIGKYIAFLDCDDVWLPEKLEKQIGLLEKDQDISLVYSNYFWLNVKKIRKPVLKGVQPTGYVFEKFLYSYPVGMLTAVVRRNSLEGLPGGLFDKNLNLGEEYDIFMRLVYKHKAGYIKEPLAFYRIHRDMCSVKYRSKYPDETKYVLHKLLSLYPEINEIYPMAIAHLNAYINIYYAKIELLNGNSTKARKIFSDYKLLNHNTIGIFLSTFFPPKIFKLLVNLRKGIIPFYQRA